MEYREVSRPDEFWKKYDAGDFGKPDAANSKPAGNRISTYKDPAFKKWEQEVAKMPAEEQVDAVTRKLVELNRGFKGQETHKIEDGKVFELNIDSNDDGPFAREGFDRIEETGNWPFQWER